MSEVLSIHIPRELKEKMKKYGINWSREIRHFIETRIKTLELLELLDTIEEKAANRRTRVDSALLIRESREKH